MLFTDHVPLPILEFLSLPRMLLLIGCDIFGSINVIVRIFIILLIISMCCEHYSFAISICLTFNQNSSRKRWKERQGGRENERESERKQTGRQTEKHSVKKESSPSVLATVSGQPVEGQQPRMATASR